MTSKIFLVMPIRLQDFYMNSQMTRLCVCNWVFICVFMCVCVCVVKTWLLALAQTGRRTRPGDRQRDRETNGQSDRTVSVIWMCLLLLLFIVHGAIMPTRCPADASPRRRHIDKTHFKENARPRVSLDFALQMCKLQIRKVSLQKAACPVHGASTLSTLMQP